MDHPRFAPISGNTQDMHFRYHGGAAVELLLQLADRWLASPPAMRRAAVWVGLAASLWLSFILFSLTGPAQPPKSYGKARTSNPHFWATLCEMRPPVLAAFPHLAAPLRSTTLSAPHAGHTIRRLPNISRPELSWRV